MIIIKLYTYKLVPDIRDREVNNFDYKAIDIVQNTAMLIAKMYKGIAECSSSGVVQYDDTVKLPELSDDDQQFLSRAFPFISIRKVNDY